MIYLLGTTDFTKKVNPYFKEFSDCRGSAFVLSQDNVHRGMILGMLAGAATDEVPLHLKEGLREYEAIDREINDFVALYS